MARFVPILRSGLARWGLMPFEQDNTLHSGRVVRGTTEMAQGGIILSGRARSDSVRLHIAASHGSAQCSGNARHDLIRLSGKTTT